MKKIMIALCAMTLLVAAGTGCRSTAEGVGEDMERAGEKIQDKVD